jgi:hypothetical protein
MIRIGVRIVAALVTALFVVGAGLASAQSQKPREQKSVVWTLVIPEGFPGDVFTWRQKPDGTYEEDGRNSRGEAIQQTLSGRWTVEGRRMIFRQDGLSYVFDGMLARTRYSGKLYLGTGFVSSFCAWQGTKVPTGCDDDLVG